MNADRRDRWLCLCLRGAAVAEAFALAGVLMPTSVMAAIHAWAGLGEFPSAIVVPYMARMASGLYVIHAGFLWMIATDLTRYRPFVLYVAVAGLLFSAAMLACLVGLGAPRWWTLSEGLAPPAFYVALIWMSRPVKEA
jgi:hypothetical protein